MSGTIVNINQGTQTGIANDSVGGTMYQTIKLDIGTAGVSNLFSGTLPSVTSVGSVTGVGGTVQVNLVGTEPIIVEVGTISAGTINTGTIDLVKAGTITKLEGGSIIVTNGTIGAGTISTNILPLGGVVKTTAVVCGTTATALPATPLTSRKTLIGYNVGTISVSIGDGTVTTTSGIPVGTSQYTPAMDLGTTILYGISGGTSGGTLVIMEVS